MGVFIFECPFCRQRLECDDALENQETRCPSCGNEIVPTRSGNSASSTNDDFLSKISQCKSSNKQKKYIYKKDLFIGAAGGFLVGLLISATCFNLFLRVEKKAEMKEHENPKKIGKVEKIVQQQNKVENKGNVQQPIPVTEKKTEVKKELVVTLEPIKPVKKRILPDIARQDMLQIKILSSDWSKPTPAMLNGMGKNDALKLMIEPMVHYMPYPKTWDLSFIKKAALCEIEGEPGQVYISGKIGNKDSNLSLIFQKDDSDDKIDFGLYATENSKVFIEFALNFHFLGRKFNDLANRFKTGTKKKKSEKINNSSWNVRGHNYYGEISFLYNPNDSNYPFSGKIYTRENGFINVKMTGEEFAKMSLALLYAFKKLEDYHLKRYYWYKKKQ